MLPFVVPRERVEAKLTLVNVESPWNTQDKDGPWNFHSKNPLMSCYEKICSDVLFVCALILHGENDHRCWPLLCVPHFEALAYSCFDWVFLLPLEKIFSCFFLSSWC